MALGFGPSSTQTTLGQPLNFAASVMLEADETVSRDCVYADVYAGEAKVAPRNVRAVLEATRDATQRIVRVTTAVVIDEPIVTIEVSVGCGSRVSRRFVTFIDPPSLQLAETDTSETVPPSRGIDSQTASLADIARQADASRRPGAVDASVGEDDRPTRGARSVPRARRIAVASAASAAPMKSRHRHASAKVSPAVTRTALSAPPRTGGARLRLEAPRVLAALPASAASAASATAVTPAVVASPDAEQVVPPVTALAVPPAPAASESTSQAIQRERIQVLEAGLARVRIDSQATQQTVAALQARLRQAEGERYSNWLVYVLIGTTLFGVFVALALWWLRPRQRRRARWFDAQASQQARAGRSSVQPSAARSSSPSPSIAATETTDSAVLWTDHPANLVPTTRPASIGGLEVTTVLGPEMSRPMSEPSTGGATGGARRTGELSMEELIDLEQQAEFFVVLGQDEAAMSLLEGYMRGTGGKSPLPYLQLLEIHQRRGEQLAYDRVRISFNERFNAYAPDWSSDLHFGRALEGYPQTVARLQSLWTTPLSAMQALDNLLFRRHAAEETFDFPAYRELLFLYSIARELSGNVETDFGSIDLFLPLEGTPAEEQEEEKDQDDIEAGASQFAVDLDVSNWPEDATMSDLLIRRNPGRRGAG